ncbi:Serine/threonine-protein kinase flr-4 [Trichostrongylus colubriformis]|uniref:Serine/threonine-protein kinase flr-4 n=1 Tax=Trichostrongylus colubriformis TaxID=6319 RepID=A0AAN8IQW7_TRICO
MNSRFHSNEVKKECLSGQLLRWIRERVPVDDPIRIKSLSSYKELQSLGKGRFGEILKYMNTSKMVHETVKRVPMELFDHWSQSDYRISQRLDVFINEFRHLHRISLANDRIANFLGLYADDHQLLIFTEYLPNGSVKDKIMNDNINENTAIHYFIDALKALDYLHTLDPPVIHRDIKAANLLLTISDNIKLANFGLVRDLAVDGFGIAVASDISLDFRGTLLYVAPEILTSELGPGNRKAYRKPADVWALGCTLIEMLTKYPPHFEYFGQVDVIQKEILDRASGDRSNWLPYDADVLVPTCSSTVHKLVDVIFERDPVIRPNTSELCDIVESLVHSDNQASATSHGPCMSLQGAAACSTAVKTEAEQKVDEVRKDSAPESLLKYTPLETVENGVVRRKRKVRRRTVRRGGLQKLSISTKYYLSRILYFAGTLGKSVSYVISFLLLGIGTLAFFLFLSFCIVLSVRYLIKLSCDCDLWQPQYIIISGILLILLFALLFSCCMVALGEYKFRIANKTFRESRFFIKRPQHDLVLCGLTILHAKRDTKEEDEEEELAQGIPPMADPVHASSIDRNFYYK